MSEKGFEFLQNTISGNWVVLAPKRASRPDVSKGAEPVCPFCPGREDLTPPEIYRQDGGKEKSHWEIRVVPNKFPFAPVHEIIIHDPDHHASFFNFKEEQLAKIFRVYKLRYNARVGDGQVLIFNNHGIGGGESLPHSHSQLVVVPNDIKLDTPRSEPPNNVFFENKSFSLFVPDNSQWPYEVWFLPKQRGRSFGEVTDEEIEDLSKIFPRLFKKLQELLGEDFPFNFYIYQGGDWYLRIIPRKKVVGGFELGTGVYVNTKDPKEAAKELSFT
jgi:UDPglucose--hexose-1-phosphate uridylyltransferase